MKAECYTVFNARYILFLNQQQREAVVDFHRLLLYFHRQKCNTIGCFVATFLDASNINANVHVALWEKE